jgi:hypothetical protein
MYVDSQNEFSDAQAVTASAISANVIDIFSTVAGGATGSASAIIAGVAPNARIDIGQGEDVYLIVNTVTAATDVGNDATMTVTLESADDAALTVNPTVHFSSGALAFAAFSPAGSSLVAIKIPAALYRRYIGVRYTVAAGPLTAGTFDAFIAKDLQANRIYRSAVTVQ